MTSFPLFEICRNFSTVFEGECKNGHRANISPKKRNWPRLKVNIKFAGDGRSLFNQEAKVVVSCEMLISKSQGYVKKIPCFIKPFFPEFVL